MGRGRRVPRELFARCAKLGWFGSNTPQAYGGTAAGPLYEAVLLEELSRCGSGGVAAGLGAQATISTGPIGKYGSDDQSRFLPAPAIRGEKIGALGITEPNAGSDVAALQTTARRDGDHYVVNGAKTYITNGRSLRLRGARG